VPKALIICTGADSRVVCRIPTAVWHVMYHWRIEIVWHSGQMGAYQAADEGQWHLCESQACYKAMADGNHALLVDIVRNVRWVANEIDGAFADRKLVQKFQEWTPPTADITLPMLT